MKEEKYLHNYPAVITYYDEDTTCDVDFIDFESWGTCSDGEGYIQKYAEERLKTAILEYEEENKELPVPTSPRAIKLESNQYVQMFTVNMLVARKERDTKTVKKNCTIPYWIKKMAEDEGINFSRVLLEGLEKELVIKNYDIKEEVKNMKNMNFETKANTIITMLNNALESEKSVVRFKFMHSMEDMKSARTVDIIAVVEDAMLTEIENTCFLMSDKFYGIVRAVIKELDLEEKVRPRNNTGNTFSFVLI